MILLSTFLADFPVFFLLCLSLLISFRLLKFPDLSIDAAYAAGMASFAYFTKNLMLRPPYDLAGAILACLAIGAAIGTVLAFLHKYRRTRISKLLSGLIVAFVAYALIFRLNGYATSQGLYNLRHSLNELRKLAGEGTSGDLAVWATMTLLAAVVAAFAMTFFRSGYGLLVRASAQKAFLVEQGGRSSTVLMGVGLAVASSCAVFAGMTRAATDNYSDVNTFGFFLFALAGVLCGERLLSFSPTLRERMILPNYRVLSAVLGSIIISFLIAISIVALNILFGIYLGADVRLIIGLLVALLAANVLWKQETFHLSDD